MQDKVHVGVIGTGRMGSVHVRNLVRRIPQANVTAVCDIRLDVAEAVDGRLAVVLGYAAKSRHENRPVRLSEIATV